MMHLSTVHERYLYTARTLLRNDTIKTKPWMNTSKNLQHINILNIFSTYYI